MKFTIKKFKELTAEDLYRILKLRFDVFVVEQKSIYNEFDDIDYDARHIFLRKNKEIIAYLRAFKKTGKIAKLGRIVVAPKYRKMGIGRKLINTGINCAKNKFKASTLEIEAQSYLENYQEQE